jgi:hypothetical protein
MAIALEKRIRRLENFVGCPNHEHTSGVLFVGVELTAEDQARIDSMHACLRCKNKQPIIYQTNVPEDID